MRNLEYSEEQRFTSIRWLWVVLATVMLGMLLVFILDEGSKNNYKQIVLTFVGSLFPIGILLASKLQLRVDNDGLHYRFFPSAPSWKHISVDRIESMEVEGKKGLCSVGYRRRIFRNMIYMNICGKKFLKITLTGGRKLKIGAKNADEMARILNKLKNPSEL